jgi:hypothetical protein
MPDYRKSIGGNTDLPFPKFTTWNRGCYGQNVALYLPGKTSGLIGPLFSGSEHELLTAIRELK